MSWSNKSWLNTSTESCKFRVGKDHRKANYKAVSILTNFSPIRASVLFKFNDMAGHGYSNLTTARRPRDLISGCGLWSKKFLAPPFLKSWLRPWTMRSTNRDFLPATPIDHRTACCFYWACSISIQVRVIKSVSCPGYIVDRLYISSIPPDPWGRLSAFKDSLICCCPWNMLIFKMLLVAEGQL